MSNYVDTTTTQSISGVKTFNSLPLCSVVVSASPGSQLVNKTYTDATYLDRTNNLTQSVSGLKTFSNNLTCSSQLISTNVTAPTTTSICNLFTNLGFLGELNIGGRGSNININTTLIIKESAYGTSQTSRLFLEGNSLRFDIYNSTNGNYIFTINESGAYNPLIINKTSVIVEGDLEIGRTIGGNILLYDKTPSTKNITIGLLNDTITFEPNNTFSTTYNFQANNGIGLTSTPLSISSTATTINNDFNTNAQTTFNTYAPLCSQNASSNNQLVNWQTLNGQSFTTLALVQSNANTFSATNTFSNTASFNGQVNIKNNLLFYDIASPYTKYTRIFQSGNDTSFTQLGGGVSTTFAFNTLNASSVGVKSLLLSSTTATIPVNLAVSGNTTMSGTASISSDLTLRETKLYNKVKLVTITPATLSFPLEENILIAPPGVFSLVLPLLNSTTQMGMTFNFVTNHATNTITISVSSGSTNTIIRNGNVTGTSSAVLLGDGITSVNLTCIEYNSGVYSWVVLNSSLPQQISNPVGSILTMANGTLPKGYLACNGTTYPISNFPALYDVIGNTFGGTSGVNFTTPYYNNYSAFLRGKGDDALAYGVVQNSNIKPHSHDILFGYDDNMQGSGGSGFAYNSTYNSLGLSLNNPGIGPERARGVTENNTSVLIDDTYPINFAVFYCIKY